MNGLTVMLLLVSSFSTAAPLPRQIGVHGKLVDHSGAPRDGSFDLTFNIYDDPAGAAGAAAPLYTETQTVAVTNGVFSADLGAVNALTPGLFSGASAYLGITVAGDDEMTPLQQLDMSAYAFTAEQLVQRSDIRVNPGAAYSTFTAAGNWKAAAGLRAADAAVAGGVTASSATFAATGSGQYSLEASTGIKVLRGTLVLSPSSGGLDASGTGLRADTGTFTATGGDVYGLEISSGLDVQAGTVRVRDENGLDSDYGVHASTLAVAEFVENEPAPEPPPAPAGTGRLFYDQAENRYEVSEDGGAYARLTAPSDSQNLWDTDSVAAVNNQGRNLPTALTELDAAVKGSRVVIDCDAIGGQVAMRYNLYSVSTRARTIGISVLDTSNTSNVLASASVAVNAAGTYTDETAYADKPAWCTGSKEVAVYTDGGNGTLDYIFKRVALIWKP